MVSFRKWMDQYKEERSPIGDLARDIVAEGTFPKSSNVDVIFEYMEKRDARLEYYKSFYKAWGMYERERAIEELFRRNRMAMRNYERLISAIISQAVDDYRAALKALSKNPKNIQANRDKSECERFFLGKWFSELTDVDGKWLMHKLQREAERA